MGTPVIKGQSSLPSLGRARPGQPVPPAGEDGRPPSAFRPAEHNLASDGMLPPAATLPGQRTEADRQEMLEAELQALRHPVSGKPGEARSWSYLATEGGKGKGAGQKK